MSDNEKKTSDTIVIKKIKKGGEGHHGGAWKIAYADFVTAMMAFFLLMWLISSLNTSQREGIADYFKQPLKVSLIGGPNVGDRAMGIPGGGKDVLKKDGQVKNADSPSEKKNILASEKTLAERAKEDKQLQDIKKLISTTVDSSPTLSKFKNQIMTDITSEGLRIQIVDKDNHSMFALGSDQLEPRTAALLKALVPIINQAPNRISILGHTDAKAYDIPGKDAQSNWELSSQRANSARRELVADGLSETKILRVLGYSSSLLLDKKNPYNPSNRRISIILMKKEVEEHIVSDK
jgi:chemotaxis protein MotB